MVVLTELAVPDWNVNMEAVLHAQLQCNVGEKSFTLFPMLSTS